MLWFVLEFDINRIEEIQKLIHDTCQKIGRSPSEVQILAAIKDQNDDQIQSLFQFGIKLFGENRFQQVTQRNIHLPEDSQYHFIGALQSNKIRKLIGCFDCIESIDKIEHAEKINSICLEESKTLNCFIQVNIGDESQKRGVYCDHLEGFVEQVVSMDHLSIQGLMCITPKREDPEQVRPFFAKMSHLNQKFIKIWPDEYGGKLSMGMSRDFLVAIEEGSNIIRLGTKIFGSRKLK